ncbi:hypothetical protein MPTK2_8g17040 [Marchantia polymorpha subsp. ruderalis]
MLIYTGFFSYSPYPKKSDQALVLVVENDFELGAPVTAMWQWTCNEDRKGLNVRCVGTFSSFETGNVPYDYTTFVAFGDQEYSLRLLVREDRSKITVQMYKTPKTGRSDREMVDEFDLDYSVVSDSVRTRAPDYSPARGLPEIQYFDMIEWNENLFTLTVPDNLCHDGPIWVTFVDSDLHSELGTIKIIEETPENVRISFTAGEYDAEVRLDSEGSSWELLTFNHRSAVSAVRESEECPVSEKESDLPIGLASKLHPMMEFRSVRIFRSTSRVMNDLKEAYLCTLDESGATVRGKVLAGMGLFMGGVGIMPLGGFGLPLAIVGALLAGVGMYDAVNDADGAVRGFLFPGDDIERTTSGGFAFGVNSLVVMHVLIEDKTLTLRIGTKSKLDGGDHYLSALIDEKGFFEPIFKIFWNELTGVVLQSARMMKISGLIPCCGKLQDLPSLSEGSQYTIGRGHIISNDQGRDALWNTLNVKPNQMPIELFRFGGLETAIIVEASDEKSLPAPMYEFFRLPESKIWVFSLENCHVYAERSRLVSSKCRTEADVYAKMVQQAGYYAYMYEPPTLIGYKLEDLSMASITCSSYRYEKLFIPISGWMPWQRMVPALRENELSL